MKEKNIFVNIITPFPHDTFVRQLPFTLKDEGIIIYENDTRDYIWDMVIVYEGIKNEIKLKCKTNGLIFITGEPPWRNYYSSKFLKQFDHVVTSHKRIKHSSKVISQQSLPWHLGYNRILEAYNFDINFLKTMTFPKKDKNISLISSSKRLIPGHRKRMNFIEGLQKEFGNAIDYYGKEINPIDDKAVALMPYRFTICIENSNIDDYWTEKIADPYLAYSKPIYFGCKNITSYFPTNSLQLININNKRDSYKIIENILNNSHEIYDSSLPSIIEARNLIFEKYNIDKIIISFYSKFRLEKEKKYKKYLLRKNEQYSDYIYGVGILRFKRLLLRAIF